MDCIIIINESNGIDRIKEPVTMGVPFKMGALKSDESLTLQSSYCELPLQHSCTSYWPDGSVKWGLIDFQVDIKKLSSESFTLIRQNTTSSKEQEKNCIKYNIADMVFDTGPAQFIIDKNIFRPFSSVTVDGEIVSDSSVSQMILKDSSGKEFEPEITHIQMEMMGCLHVIVKIDGYFGTRKKPLVRWFARVHFYAGKKYSRIDFTIWNSGPAKHPDGLWDLGDPGSFLFTDLSVHSGIVFRDSLITTWRAEKDQTFTSEENCTGLIIFQGSSGGENWSSKNHVNRLGLVPNILNGYQVRLNSEMILAGKRAEPVVHISNKKCSIALVTQKFWQNFPKTLEVDNNILILRLFPEHYGDLFELQGGERKTHTFYVNYNGESEDAFTNSNPISYRICPEYLQSTNVFPYLSINPDSAVSCYREMVNSIINGENSFFKRRETIDEFGWRHFGELYADHEAVGYEGEGPLISHYNNQYDFIYSAARQYAATGNSLWFELMDDLARHVRDIDIYYTDKDRPEYNGGFFWHTNHYLDAGTCTHRSQSVIHLKFSNPQFCGGGPALEHNYTSGLTAHYYATGEESSKEAVISLADWVMRDTGRTESFTSYLLKLKSKIELYKKVFRGEIVPDYSYPFTRGSGNSISTLLDAYSLTKNRQYIDRAEEIIKGCINPCDDIDRRDLLNPEISWSYTVCLQAIGKYLDFKVSGGEFDEMFTYARVSLLKYAKWMLENETPYFDMIEKLEYPNETWTAQDMRKSCVFYFAAKYAHAQNKNDYIEKAGFYYRYSVNKTLEFKTRDLTRPLVLLLLNSSQHHFYMERPESIDGFHCPEQAELQFSANTLTRLKILRSFIKDITYHVFHFSLFREWDWIKCRLYRHV